MHGKSHFIGIASNATEIFLFCALELDSIVSSIKIFQGDRNYLRYFENKSQTFDVCLRVELCVKSLENRRELLP